MERAHEHGITMLYLKVWGAWSLMVKVEQALRQHGFKIDAKREQLLGVQQMFRNFAMQLESSIRSSQESDDVDLSKGVPNKYKKQLNKNEGTSSLPDIHAQDPRHGSYRGMGQGYP